MSDDDIDLDRVVVDPGYRRRVIEFLNTSVRDPVAPAPAAVGGEMESGTPRS